jgi:hypothetical protein
MIIFISLVVVSIVIGLILLSVVKTSSKSGYTSLGTLKSEAKAKASIARKKKPLVTAEMPLEEISTSPQTRVSATQEAHVSPQNEEAVYIAELRQKLLRKAMGNVATVERLTDYERRLNPRGTLTTWLKTAVDRWEDDHEGRRRG